MEIVVILLIQLLILHAVDYNVWSYFWLGPFTVYVCSAILSAYISTNHGLNAIVDDTDPVLSSMSVRVPRFLDFLHSNFSYHTEHHVFPSMNSSYYPMVSKLLREHFPERYNRMDFREVYTEVWRASPYAISRFSV